MSTLKQLIRKKRKKKIKKKKSTILNKCPQKKGICSEDMFHMSPKKPNSARRNVCRLKIFKIKKFCTAYVPGQYFVDKPIQKFANILIRGGRVKDLPGIKYKVIRGKYDVQSVVNRKKSRSKYGTQR